MLKTVVITGAAGVLGSDLVRKFTADPAVTVYALSSNPARFPAEFCTAPNIRICSNDDLFDGKIPLETVDCLIHAAFARSQNGTELVSSINFTRKVFECSVNKVKRFINVSTQGVYGGSTPTRSSEDDPINPADLYSMAKYACEELARIIFNNSTTAVTNIRLASLMGERYMNHLVAKITRAALDTHVIKVAGGTQRFSFLHSDDAVDGIFTVATSDAEKWKWLYNLGTDGGIVLTDIARGISEAVGKAVGKKIPLEFRESNDAHTISLNMSRMKQDFNWQAQRTLVDAAAGIIRKIQAAKGQ